MNFIIYAENIYSTQFYTNINMLISELIRRSIEISI